MNVRRKWSEKDLEERLDAVRRTLVAFLEQRNVLDRYKRKERWRLMRQFIWPGAPDGFRQMLESTAETDAHAHAILRNLEERKREITGVIERYNHAIRRYLEQECGKPIAEFDEEEKGELSRRQITFAGTRKELLRKSRELEPDSPPEIVGEILSLRIGILNAEARDALFQEVARTRAEESAGDRGGLTEEEIELEALAIEWQLRIRDRYFIARILAATYEEARRLLRVDDMLEWIDAAMAEAEKAPDRRRFLVRRAEILGDATRLAVRYLEELWPTSLGAHRKLLARLPVP